ncbi:MAG: RagB/SusD family nutrient uptake outer membrane protein [Bacteroidota bacterium]
MKKKIFFTTLAVCLMGAGSCKKDSDFLNAVVPIGIIDSQIEFNDPALTLAAIGRLYNAEVDFSGLDNNWSSFTDFGESFASENGHATQGRTTWSYDSWANWDYTYIRELNLFLERIAGSTGLTAADKARFAAEARFLRAAQYFELAKRMGGVPIITKSIVYESGPVSAVQFPRNKESEVYDFVLSECDAIKDILPKLPATKSRATAGAALAMATRAALYAGSIAKYGVNTPTVTLSGDVVGIPAAMATGYYTKALASAQLLIGGTYGSYKLYQTALPAADNYAAVFTDKSSTNNEVIYIEDFKAFAGKVHGFTTNDQPYSNGEEIDDAGRLNPTLNLVQAFEKLDGTLAPFATRDITGAPAYYDTPQDIFAGRDARLAGTVLIPGAIWKSAANDIWAGYWTPNANPANLTFEQGTITTSDVASNLKPLPGTTIPVQVVGKDGPINGLQFHTQTGFYIRKWLDPNVGTGRRGQGSDIPFIRYRYSEVLLNAAEAAAELNQFPVASDYINQVRARAGLTVPLVLNSANYFDRIVHERRVELCFEGLNLFDYKRWRIATQVWDGQNETVTDLTTNLLSATHRNTKQWGLWPYKVYSPGNAATNGKWIFKEVVPAPNTGVLLFRLGNYYSQISDAILGSNPKLLRQPNQ